LVQRVSRGPEKTGRAPGPAGRATIGAAPLGETARGQEIRDVIDVARALWDSGEDDAVIKDVASGRFIDNDKVHHVRFEGASFSVVGPLIAPRPPQGQVVVIAADSLGAADRADITTSTCPVGPTQSRSWRRWRRSPTGSGWSPPRTRRTTSRLTSRAVSPASTSSPTGGPDGTS
jgi:alkanesulfonate monooxygenase SsuD/methylene tetrahydromethanopterin reductase-like flavin-dependent oxidoreductase (luciferase family)